MSVQRTDSNEAVREKAGETPVLPAEAAAPTLARAAATGYQGGFERRLGALARIRAAIYFTATLVGIALLARFVLLLLGAGMDNAFGDIVMTITDSLLAPFSHMFPAPGRGGGGVLEVVDLLATAAYFILAWIVVKVFKLAVAPSDPSGRLYE